MLPAYAWILTNIKGSCNIYYKLNSPSNWRVCWEKITWLGRANLTFLEHHTLCIRGNFRSWGRCCRSGRQGILLQCSFEILRSRGAHCRQQLFAPGSTRDSSIHSLRRHGAEGWQLQTRQSKQFASVFWQKQWSTTSWKSCGNGHANIYWLLQPRNTQQSILFQGISWQWSHQW